MGDGRHPQHLCSLHSCAHTHTDEKHVLTCTHHNLRAERTQEQAMGAIRNISVSPQYETEIVKAGGVPRIVAMLRSFSKVCTCVVKRVCMFACQTGNMLCIGMTALRVIMEMLTSARAKICQ